MSNPPGVSVSQIATQVEAFDQMWIELVSFPDMAEGDLSACVPWQRGMGGHFYHCATACSEIIRIYPGRGGLLQSCTAKRRNRSCCSCTVGQEILIFRRSADSGCHQWLSG